MNIGFVPISQQAHEQLHSQQRPNELQQNRNKPRYIDCRNNPIHWDGIVSHPFLWSHSRSLGA